MPLDSNHILHAWTKQHRNGPSTNKMPTEPEKRGLLGFTDVEAEHPKWYIRRLWLVAENDRKPFPMFLDPQVQELATQVNRVVNTFVKDEDMRHEELCGGAFLEKDAAHILNELGFGQRIWGDGSGAEIRLGSNLSGPRPRWGVRADSGYKSNDEDSIRDNLRYWMAALIQAKINAPCKEKKGVPSVTVERMEQLPQAPTSVPASPSLPQWPERMQSGGSPDTSGLAPSRSKRRRSSSAATAEAETKAASNRPRSKARSDDSSGSVDTFSFTSYIHTGPDADFPHLRSDGYKCPRTDNSQRRSRSLSRRQSLGATLTAGDNPPTDTAVITTPDVASDSGNNMTTHEDDLPRAIAVKRKLQLDLSRLLSNKPDFTGILHDIIPPTRKLYAISPHRKPYSDMEVEFRNFNRALDHWGTLIRTRMASPGAVQSPAEDHLEALAAKGTFADRVAMLHKLGPRSHIDFPFKQWTISLALFFEGLLGDTYMPLPFRDLVDRLRTVNRPLYGAVRYGE
ncbi:hypothetical protein J4E82_010785 [Alternaria postmessia]|uniref:uncharacterized protein n=1 Tax=Alternaria postmessia TaxID=1187938 RepID=UPI0022248678|nr:uncharacterized protein J4E82_010785 [Alternaria postmessia]KAI5368421.1 hypothetical protein J4E82_010785 [Alternaria postmessia]